MTVRLIRAARVADDLAAGRIGARDQSLYLNASFLIWLIPAYLFLFPAPRTAQAEFFWTVWLVELALLVAFCIGGIAYCLRRCRVQPERNFLVDFSCLNAPVSLTTLVVAWGLFHLLTALVAFTPTAYDILRMLVSAGAALVVFLRIGAHMARVSETRVAPPAGGAAVDLLL